MYSLGTPNLLRKSASRTPFQLHDTVPAFDALELRGHFIGGKFFDRAERNVPVDLADDMHDPIVELSWTHQSDVAVLAQCLPPLWRETPGPAAWA